MGSMKGDSLRSILHPRINKNPCPCGVHIPMEESDIEPLIGISPMTAFSYMYRYLRSSFVRHLFRSFAPFTIECLPFPY